MRNPVVGGLGLVAAVCAAVVVAAPKQSPEPGLVNTLDRSFQSKFETIDGKLFGVTRIPTTPEHGETWSFAPQAANDKQLKRELVDAGWQVVFYVAGRSALYEAESAAKQKPRPTMEELIAAGKPVFTAEAAFGNWRTVSRPIFLTPAGKAEAAPKQSQIGTLAPDAFAAFAKKASHREFAVNDWTVIARPIPASKVGCLACHKGRDGKTALKLGDTLGVAFYAFGRPGAVAAAPGADKPQVPARTPAADGGQIR